MQQLNIRPVELKDFDTVYNFICLLEESSFDKAQQELIFRNNVENPQNIYMLALHEDIPVGFVSCHVQLLLHHNGPVGEIQELFVDPDYRGHGIGGQLENKLLQIAKQRGIIQIEVTTNLKRIMAHSFYERQQFLHTHKKFVKKL